MNSSQILIEKKLLERRLAGTYRELKPESTLIDFCSNDYLGFARSPELKNKIDEEVKRYPFASTGSTGSRLLSGNSAYAENLEKYLAALHNSEAGLIFNSGYDANLGLFSSLPQRGDTIITDELIHASIIDGARLSFASRFSFKHNDLQNLEEKLKHAKGICYVAIESVYSMNGDKSPIEDVLELTDKYGAHLIVDEAHAIGLYGLGLAGGPLRSGVFARIVTFGKALGCHGAMVLGSNPLKEYLVNFSRSFIYSTAPCFHQLASVKMAYDRLLGSADEIESLKNNINLFRGNIKPGKEAILIESESAIQCIIVKGKTKVKEVALNLQNAGLDVRAILSPTVPEGTERIRICLHSFNTNEEILLLINTINKLIDGQ